MSAIAWRETEIPLPCSRNSRDAPEPFTSRNTRRRPSTAIITKRSFVCARPRQAPNGTSSRWAGLTAMDSTCPRKPWRSCISWASDRTLACDFPPVRTRSTRVPLISQKDVLISLPPCALKRPFPESRFLGRFTPYESLQSSVNHSLAFSVLPHFVFNAPAQTWTQTGAPSNYWAGVACSADGTALAAITGGQFYVGQIYTSTNAGTNWTLSSAPSLHCTSVASSAHGNHLAALAY